MKKPNVLFVVSDTAPVVLSFSLRLALGQILTVSGRNLGSGPCNVTFELPDGGSVQEVQCTNAVCAATTATCTLSVVGLLGRFLVTVNVPGSGVAKSSATLAIVPAITTVSVHKVHSDDDDNHKFQDYPY